MKRLCKNTNRQSNLSPESTSVLSSWISLSVLLIAGLISGPGEAVTVTSLKGNVFVILPQGKVQEAHYGQKLPDFTELMTDESSQVAWRDDAGNFFQLASSGHLRFLNKIVELQQGHLWMKTSHPQQMSVQTANAVVNFQKADGIVSFDPENSRTQVMATSGQFELSNILMREVTQVIGPGEFSFIDPQYEEGRPRLATSVGKNSYKKMTGLFIGHNEDGLPAPARLPASVEEPGEAAVVETAAVASKATPELKATAEVLPTPVVPVASVAVGEKAAASKVGSKAKMQQKIQVKTYGDALPSKRDAAKGKAPKSEQKNPQVVQEVPAPPVGSPTPDVTPGKIVYYLPDYEQEHQIQRDKVASFYQKQVAQMVATPSPTPFTPDYKTASNTSVKVLGPGSRKLSSSKSSVAPKAARKVASVPAAGEKMVETGLAEDLSQAQNKMDGKALAPEKATAPSVQGLSGKLDTQNGLDDNSPQGPSAEGRDPAAAEQKRNPASVDENRPLEKITLDQFTRDMRLSNEANKLMRELKSYRIDRQGR